MEYTSTRRLFRFVLKGGIHLSIIILVSGLILGGMWVIYVGQVNRAQEKYIVFDERGITPPGNVTFFLEADHVYEVYVRISERDKNPEIFVNLRVYLDGELRAEDTLFAQENTEVAPGEYEEELVSDEAFFKFEPRTGSDMLIEFKDYEAQKWSVEIKRDLPLDLSHDYLTTVNTYIGIVIIFLFCGGGISYWIFGSVKDKYFPEEKKEIQLETDELTPRDKKMRMIETTAGLIISCSLTLYGVVFLPYFDGIVFLIAGLTALFIAILMFAQNWSIFKEAYNRKFRPSTENP
ncbi:MAG: hypothetical protein ACFFD4_29285 [Candidatus Odinarchaeota archaeon]